MTREYNPSATIPRDRLLPGIHGLRGIAALAVVLFHLIHIAKIDAPLPFAFIGRDFGYGVHLFFVLSAFSLMHSTEFTMSRPAWVSEYFIKRFWRIAPLYYVVLALMVFLPAIKSGSFERIDLQKLLLNLTFTFNFAPWTGMVWAGWTIGVEMIFYVIFPVLLLTVRTTSATLLLLGISVLVSLVSRSILQGHYAATVGQYGFNWAYFSFISNACFFIMGMYAFRVAHELDAKSKMARLIIPAFAVLVVTALLFARLGDFFISSARLDIVLWGLGFAMVTVWQSIRPSFWCANRFFEYVGERSYSVYLMHPIIISGLLKSPLQMLYHTFAIHLGAYAYFFCTALALIPILAISEVTYRFVEVPAIRYGRRINKNIRDSKMVRE